MNKLFLSIIALIPAIVLCGYIYKKDHVEKEPMKLLVALFLAGVVAFIPIYYLESYLIRLVDAIFSVHMDLNVSGVVSFSSMAAKIAHHAVCGFVVIAVLEEGVKWLLLYFITSKHKEFDHLFDGIIYSVFVSLGFAALENIFYAVRDGWEIFILRSLTTVPAHMIFGVLMGFGYTMWHTYQIAEELEQKIESDGQIIIKKPFDCRGWVMLSIVLPMTLHGSYSFLGLFRTEMMINLFYVFIFVIYITCFVLVHRMSADDRADKKAAYYLLRKKYPTLNEDV